MDEARQTVEYRKAQFDKLGKPDSEYKSKLKFIRPEGKYTYWMDITEEELEKIKAVLTRRQA